MESKQRGKFLVLKDDDGDGGDGGSGFAAYTKADCAKVKKE